MSSSKSIPRALAVYEDDDTPSSQHLKEEHEDDEAVEGDSGHSKKGHNSTLSVDSTQSMPMVNEVGDVEAQNTSFATPQQQLHALREVQVEEDEDEATTSEEDERASRRMSNRSNALRPPPMILKVRRGRDVTTKVIGHHHNGGDDGSDSDGPEPVTPIPFRADISYHSSGSESESDSSSSSSSSSSNEEFGDRDSNGSSGGGRSNVALEEVKARDVSVSSFPPPVHHKPGLSGDFSDDFSGTPYTFKPRYSLERELSVEIDAPPSPQTPPKVDRSLTISQSDFPDTLDTSEAVVPFVRGSSMSPMRMNRSLPSSPTRKRTISLNVPIFPFNIKDGGISDDDCKSPVLIESESRRRPGLFRARTIETHSIKKSRFEGYKKINQYILHKKKLGKGSFGKVKLVFNTKDEQYYAMKIFSKSLLKRRRVFGRGGISDDWETTKKEIAIMKKLHHPNIVKLHEVIDDEENDNLFLVLDWVERGAVMKGVSVQDPLSEDLSRKYFRDVISGLEYLHLQRVAHRDIKPQNLLLARDGSVKIADFGVSSEFTQNDDSVNNTAGSAAFMAPEICRGDSNFSARCADIWSAGVTLYMFLFGECPWMDESQMRVYEMITNDPVVFKDHTEVSDDAKDLILKMLNKTPADRISIADIKKHPWVTKNGVWPMADLGDEDKVEVEETVTEKDVKNAWILLVKIKTRLHKRAASTRAKLESRRSSSSLTSSMSKRDSRLSSPSQSKASLLDDTSNYGSSNSLRVPSSAPSSPLPY